MATTNWILDRASWSIAEALRRAPAGAIQEVARLAAERLLAQRLLREQWHGAQDQHD